MVGTSACRHALRARNDCNDNYFVCISVLNLTLLYVNSEVVIPAKAGIQIKKTGFRIRSGMTEYVK
jgi:hypothetical protein